MIMGHIFHIFCIREGVEIDLTQVFKRLLFRIELLCSLHNHTQGYKIQNF